MRFDAYSAAMQRERPHRSFPFCPLPRSPGWPPLQPAPKPREVEQHKGQRRSQATRCLPAEVMYGAAIQTIKIVSASSHARSLRRRRNKVEVRAAHWHRCPSSAVIGAPLGYQPFCGGSPAILRLALQHPAQVLGGSNRESSG